MCIAAAIVGGAVVGAGASIYSGNKAAAASDRAAQVSQNAADQQVAEAQRQYDQTRSDFAPFREAGTGALNRLNNASGGNLSDFNVSPSYNFTRSEGQRDIGNSFAARGGAASGNALKALAQFNQNLASGEFNNWWNQQLGLANIGAGGTSGTAQAGANASGQIIGALGNNAANQGNALVTGANARASGVQGAANSFNQGIGNYFLYDYLKNPVLKPSGLPMSAWNVPRG